MIDVARPEGWALPLLGFYGFLRVANAHIRGGSWFGLLDLPDRLWRGAYDNGAHPGDAANLFSHSYRFAQ